MKEMIRKWCGICFWCTIGSVSALANFIFGLVLGYYIHKNKKEDN